jgi:hypothetical protein
MPLFGGVCYNSLAASCLTIAAARLVVPYV